MSNRLANRLLGFSPLNPKVLCVTFENLPSDNFVIFVNRIERRFHRAVWSLKYHFAFFVKPDVFKNMGVVVPLQPILRPAAFPQF